MADFLSPHWDAPLTMQVLNRANFDLGAIITKLQLPNATIASSDMAPNLQRGRNEKNTSSRGVRVDVKLANKSGTVDIVVNIRRYRKAFNDYVVLLTSVSLTANGTTTYVVHPDYTAAANTIAKEHIGEEWDVQVVGGVGVSPLVDVTVAAQMLS
jgi:hypothetical protein